LSFWLLVVIEVSHPKLLLSSASIASKEAHVKAYRGGAERVVGRSIVGIPGPVGA
jgi:hypothetical protein